MKTNFSFDMQALDEGIHSRFPNHKEAPLIGLIGNFSDGNLTLAPGYYQSIIQAGGVPVAHRRRRLESVIPARRSYPGTSQHQSIPRPPGTASDTSGCQPTDSDIRHLPRDAGHQCGIGRHTLSGHLCTEGYPID